MKIVCGKFDPELLPPPFSDWSQAFTAVEIDLFQYFNWKTRTRSYFKRWITDHQLSIIPRMSLRIIRSRDEYADAISIWKNLFGVETSYYLVNSGLRQWSIDINSREIEKLAKSETYFFEWGREDSTNSVSFITSHHQFSGWVIDPDWHTSASRVSKEVALHFKLHGWNKERWVRRYGAPRAACIRRQLKAWKNSDLILSYSGKVAEADLFKSLIK